MAADIFVNNSNNQHTAPGTNIFQLRSEAILPVLDIKWQYKKSK